MGLPEESRTVRQYERLLYEGISAAKVDNRALARSLLNQAIQLNGMDARPYVWLSAITDDLVERRQYLEQAVVIDPTHTAARRGLALLNGKLNEAQILPHGTGVTPSSGQVTEVQAQVFLCPQCGGQVAYSLLDDKLVCSYCGYIQEGEAAQDHTYLADHAEKVLDFVLPTSSGHSWAASQQQLACERCGAVVLLPAEEKSIACPYCSAHQFVEAPKDEELIDPQLIMLMRIDERKVLHTIKLWLGKGLFAPDDLRSVLARLKMRPAYYSGWTFDGTLEVRWSCDVKEGSGRYAHWEPRSGLVARFFDDILISGVRALSQKQLALITPFDLKNVVEFKPEFLVGWQTLIYNRSLSDASLLAREQVTKTLRPELDYRVEPGREKRNLQTRGSGWSGMTFKHILFPVWSGFYTYRGKQYTIIVNGQTGKVGGEKPHDVVKMILGALIGALLLFVILWILFMLWNTFGANIS